MDEDILRQAFEAGVAYSGNIEFGCYAETFEEWYKNQVSKLTIHGGSKSLCSDTWCTNEVQSTDTLCNKCRGYKE